MSRWNDIPLIEVTRGSLVESIHYGAFAIVTADGELIGSGGDPELVAFLRSSSKPFQALPFVEMGGMEQFNVTDRELAVMCASHTGTDEHVAVIRNLQAKIGLTEDLLLCGIHEAPDKKTADEMIRRGESPTPIRNNCSGKHTGMLGQALLLQQPYEDYVNPSHAVQRRILQTFAEMCDVDPQTIVLGIDGCSAPVFAIPLSKAALGYARLCGPDRLSPQRARACRRITSAMSAFPEMVAGPERFDTVLMEVGRGKIISKGGAEGYQAIGLLEGACYPGSKSLGIAIKISDGDTSGRARTVVGLEILRKLGALTPRQQEKLTNFDRRVVKNHRGLTIGEIRPCFEIA